MWAWLIRIDQISFIACLFHGIVFRGVSCVGYIKKLVLFFIIMVTIFRIFQFWVVKTDSYD